MKDVGSVLIEENEITMCYATVDRLALSNLFCISVDAILVSAVGRHEPLEINPENMRVCSPATFKPQFLTSWAVFPFEFIKKLQQRSLPYSKVISAESQ